MDYQVLPLTDAFLAGAANVERACFSLPWSEDALRAELCKDGCRCFVAVSAGEGVIGWAGLESVCGEGSVTNVGVLPAFRGQGVGRALTAALLTAVAALSLDRLLLEVRVSNAAAIALYQSLGFTALGIRPRFYEFPVEDALMMQYNPPHPIKGLLSSTFTTPMKGSIHENSCN